MILQKEIILEPRSSDFYIVTREIENTIPEL